MYNMDAEQVGNEQNFPVGLEGIMSPNVYPEVFYLILANLGYKDDYESLRRVSTHIKEGMDSFKTNSPLHFKSLFLTNIRAQCLVGGVSAMCEHYLSTTSFNAFSGSGSTGKNRAERLKNLSDICVPENAHLLALAIQKLPSTQLVNMINAYYIGEKVINPHLFGRSTDARHLFGKSNTSTRDKVFELLRADFQQHVTNFNECETQVENAVALLSAYIDNHNKYGVSDRLFTALLTTPMTENGTVTNSWVQAVGAVQQALSQAEAHQKALAAEAQAYAVI